jgi:hypothetical protein
MMFFSNTMLYLFDWIAGRLELDFGPRDGKIFDALDEREVIDQLQYGRD